MANELKAQNLACAYEVRRWYPVDRVIDFIRERDIKRLILGTSSRGKLGKLLLGSVAEAIDTQFRYSRLHRGSAFQANATKQTAPGYLCHLSAS